MFKNYFKVAYRSLVRQRGYTLINVIGLAGGMTCCLLILLFVRHELSYDRFQPRAERLYRLNYSIEMQGNEINIARTPPPIAPAMQEYFPEVEATARIFVRAAGLSTTDENPKRYEETHFAFADSSITRLFHFDFVAGNPERALYEPFTLLISDEMAEKYFGTTDAVGKTLLLDGQHLFRVTGVIRSYPDNSHIHFPLLANYESMLATLPEGGRDNLAQNWIISHSFTYVLLHPQQSYRAVNAKMRGFLDQRSTAPLKDQQTFTLQPLLDLHLHAPAFQAVSEPTGDITYVYVFIAIALVTLLIACINFINLTTARSLQRAREVGMRKVLGAERTQLIGQFLGESLLLSFLSFLLSLLLVHLLLPELNALTDKSLTFSYLLEPGLLLSFVGVFLLTGLLAGAYPAFVISNYRPVESLKGNLGRGLPRSVAPEATGNDFGQWLARQGRGFSLRKVLVVAQFTASIALIGCALVAFRQLEYLRSRPLGFQQEHVLQLPLFANSINNVFGGFSAELRERLNSFEEKIAHNPNVVASTLSSDPLGSGAVRRGAVPEGFTAEDNLFFPGLSVDYDFLEAFDLELVAGRRFSKEAGTDHLEAFIVNEKAVEEFQWGTPEEAIGKTLNREGKEGKVIGVVKDFHYDPLSQPIGPFIFDVTPSIFTTLSIRIKPDDVPATLQFLESEWNDFFPQKTFVYEFLDDSIARLYDTQQRLGRIIGTFAFLAIFISAMGLLGMASYLTLLRRKEIGVRKVLGASVSGIVLMLARDFTGPILVALVLALPLSWWATDRWLQDFAYHIDQTWLFLVVSGVVALLVAWLTVSLQSIRAATANPVDSLRNE
ncbi:putative ABC transport system permease protein [Catalinimonas alkaloidigena]|uniref:Putative ABC transport system permease protein n=1 Tax=Catalinimonas alkaloidigena TaxID=1075417 RepID=A0A1G9GF84_9BACT|nr:ABC transporter permease [Catalinimonas alkaloidigena]SDK99334.1 putative ABC transport system permease protein [Catalinimonas alkaloidigena]